MQNYWLDARAFRSSGEPPDPKNLIFSGPYQPFERCNFCKAAHPATFKLEVWQQGTIFLISLCQQHRDLLLSLLGRV